MPALRFPPRCAKLAALLDVLEGMAPLKFADRTWDNVGLLLESARKAASSEYRILLTVDLTEAVAVQAGEGGYDVLVAYHPPWFKPAKSLTLDAGKEARCLAYLASRGVSVYSAHTALDNVCPGINDWVLDTLFKLRTRPAPIVPSAMDETHGAGRLIRFEHTETNLSLGDLLGHVSKQFGIPVVRYALGRDHGLDTVVRSVAVCVGAGASVFAQLPEPVDLLLTGEMSHHELLRATNVLGASVIMTEHTTMERAYLFGPFVERLVRSLGTNPLLHDPSSGTTCTVDTADDDRDPVRFYTSNC